MTPEEIISEHYRKMASARWAKLTKEERSEFARKIGRLGNKVRWGTKDISKNKGRAKRKKVKNKVITL